MLSLILGALVVGATAVLDPFDASTAGVLLRDRRIDGAYLVPTMLRLVLRSADSRPEDWSAIKMLYWGGEPMDDTTHGRIVELAGDVVHSGYGSTEIPLSAACDPRDRAVYGPSSGPATTWHSLRIVGPDGEVLSAGEEGELETCGLDGYLGYYGQPEVAPGDWYRTGDFGLLDETGRLHIAGRRSLIVNVGGNRVSPEAPAEALRRLPAVENAAVVAVADQTWGNRLHAFIVPAEGAVIDAEAMLASLRGVLPSASIPRGVTVVSELPVDASGKLSILTLRDWARRAIAERAITGRASTDGVG